MQIKTDDRIFGTPDRAPQILYWSRQSDPEEWPKIKTMSKWVFAILHPVLYRKMFHGKVSK